MITTDPHSRATVMLLVGAISLGPAPATADDRIANELQTCSSIETDSVRLACYDALAKAHASESSIPEPVAEADVTAVPAAEASAAPEPDDVPAPEAEVIAAPGPETVAAPGPDIAAAPPASGIGTVTPITDDVGKERLVATDEEEAERYAATVTRCTSSPSSRQYYFYLENGQVWKQANYRSLSYRKCEFDVEIFKDAFGYQMYIPSKDREVRVTRVR